MNTLYMRVSTDQQSIERQDHALRLYCVSLDIVAPEVFSDSDVSGSIPMGQRPDGKRLLHLLEHRDRSVPATLITTEQDRLGRDTLDIITTIRRLWQLNCTPHFSAEGGPLPKTPENELRMEIRSSLAAYERNKIRQRVSAKMQQKKAGGELCGTVPYGWDAVATGRDNAQGREIKTLVPNEREQHWLREMHRWRTEGGLGWCAIATRLNRSGVPTKQGGGRPLNFKGRIVLSTGKWQAGSVRGLLTSQRAQEFLQSSTAVPAASLPQLQIEN